jgi:peptidoglycan hydrolase-like protein with peptidoglycan-binding domain
MPGVNPAVPATPSLRALTVRLSKDLSVGSEGDDVAALQTFLVRSGYLVMPNGVAKGFFGGLTKKAVMWFQKDKGLPTPGRVGPMTRNILNQDQ